MVATAYNDHHAYVTKRKEIYIYINHEFVFSDSPLLNEQIHNPTLAPCLNRNGGKSKE